MTINQPSNQIKFTNVSVVRLKKGKKRFELACYKNKLLEYRSGAEKDIDNVLQIHTVFLSVSKGQTAPSAELAKSFGAGVPQDDIIQEILRKGEVQVGERERKDILERIQKEVVDIVSGRLVDPTTKRVYTPTMIEKALDQLSATSGQQEQQQNIEDSADHAGAAGERRKPLWKGVSTTKSAKSQALDAMKALIAWQPIPVMRARMRLRVVCPVSVLKQSVKGSASAAAPKEETKPAKGGNKKGQRGKGKKHQDGWEDEEQEKEDQTAPKAPSNVKEKILSFIESVESQEITGEEWEALGFAEPGAFKGLSEFVTSETRGRGRVEVLDMAVTHED